jgi:hypothetical protein
MSNQDKDQDQDVTARNKSEQRFMWIFSGAIVLLILGAMGANMLFHKEQPASTDISSQSRTAPEK